MRRAVATVGDNRYEVGRRESSIVGTGWVEHEGVGSRLVVSVGLYKVFGTVDVLVLGQARVWVQVRQP